MNETEFGQLVETARVRRLTPGEEARLRGWLLLHPEAQFVWDEEQQLTLHLRGLPDALLAPDFTDRVLAAVERGRTAAESRRAAPWEAWWQRWLPAPRLAVAAVAVAVVGVSLWQYRAQDRRRVAESVQAISTVAGVPGVELLQEFELINRLRQLPAGDDDGLLTALR